MVGVEEDLGWRRGWVLECPPRKGPLTPKMFVPCKCVRGNSTEEARRGRGIVETPPLVASLGAAGRGRGRGQRTHLFH